MILRSKSDITYDFKWENQTEIMPVILNVNHFNYWKNVYMFYKNVEKKVWSYSGKRMDRALSVPTLCLTL